MVKKEKGKKRNDSIIALNRPTEASEDIYTFLKNSKCVFYRPVCFTRIWKNTLRSRGKEHLEMLCQISAINFIGNSAAINFCARGSQSRALTKHSLAGPCNLCFCSNVGAPRLSLKRRKQSPKV